jgi:hypothetical protein
MIRSVDAHLLELLAMILGKSANIAICMRSGRGNEDLLPSVLLEPIFIEVLRRKAPPDVVGADKEDSEHISM